MNCQVILSTGKPRCNSWKGSLPKIGKSDPFHHQTIHGNGHSLVVRFPTGLWPTFSFEPMKPLLRVIGYLALCLLFTLLLILSALAGN